MYSHNPDDPDVGWCFEDWKLDLEAGNAEGSAFFVWLYVASVPQSEWPEWVGDFLKTVAVALFRKVHEPCHVKPNKKRLEALLVSSPGRSFEIAQPFVAEFMGMLQEPECSVHWLQGRWLDVNQHAIQVMDTDFEKNRARLLAEEQGITVLEARELIAEEEGYASESSYRRAFRNRRKKILKR